MRWAWRAGRFGRRMPAWARVSMPIAAVLVAAAAFASSGAATGPGRRLGEAFARAWTRSDFQAMYALMDRTARQRTSPQALAAMYEGAARAAGAYAVTAGRPSRRRHGVVRLPVAMRTRLFGTVRGDVALRIVGSSSHAQIAWVPADRFPGLRPGEQVTTRIRPAARGAILAADGQRLSAGPYGTGQLGDAGLEIAGGLGSPDPSEAARGEQTAGVSGLERLYDAQLAGRQGAELLLGSRVVARRAAIAGRTLRTTIRPALQRAAVTALGGRLGGVAVVQPRSGSILALAGLALSSAQPPGSTFKIITATAALEAGLSSPGHRYPVARAATLSGVTLRNADSEACGGTLINAFAVSCNSVFAPLGAAVGATRLVSAAEAYGFNDTPRLPDEARSQIPAADRIGDALAVGSTAIGQGRVLATPAEMASVAATIADRGVRARLRLLATSPVITRRVTTPAIAASIRRMMLAVVGYGTGRAATIPGVAVAGKTGTAELRSTVNEADGTTAPPDPHDTDAWFVAFPAVQHPPFAVAVMLVGAGAGGDTAAPLARQVITAGLGA